MNDPTTRYGLVLPDVGGDVGAWGGMLRTIFGEDTGPPLGLDAIIGGIEDVANAALPTAGGTMTGDLEIAPSSGESLLTLNRPATTENADVAYDNQGSVRVRAGITNTAAADYRVRMFDDMGGGTNVLTIDRSTLEVSVSNDLTVGGALNVGSFAGDGSGLTNLNASNISTGTLNTNRLPSQVDVTNFRAADGAAGNVSYGFSGAGGDDDGMFRLGNNELGFSTFSFTRLRITNSLIQALNGAVFDGNGSGLTNLQAGAVNGTLSTSNIPSLDASKITTGSFNDARLSGSYTNINNLTISGLATLEDAQIGSVGTAISRVQVFQFTFSGQASLASGAVTSQTFAASSVNSSSKLVATLNSATSDQFIVTRALPGAADITVFIHNAGSTAIDPDGTTVTVLEFVTV